MTFKARGQISVLAVLFFILTSLAISQTETALDRYIAQPDPAFQWEVRRTHPGFGFKTVVLRLTSQSWRSTDEADPHFWFHWMRIVVPTTVRSEAAMLIVNGGSHDSGQPPEADTTIGLAAAATGIVVVEVQAIPNQPIQFSDESAPRSEDAIIAYSWDKFLRDGDEEWPAQLPMTKAVVAAMDATKEYMESSDGGQNVIDKFIVGGGSKRGWASWLAAAADERVVAVIPAVIDTLNVQKAFAHHWQAYGDWSSAVSDYEEAGIFAWFGSRRLNDLMKIVDPFEYRDRLAMPKYIVNAAGDEFFVPTSSQFYFDDLEGPKYLRYVPNASHGLGETLEGALTGALSWGHAVINDAPIPEYSWEFADDGSIVVTVEGTPASVKLWQVTNPAGRDFRVETIGEAWTSTDLQSSGDGVYSGTVPAPAQGWSAFFIELTYADGFLMPITFTTAVRVLPDTLPFNIPAATVHAAQFGPLTAPDAIASVFGEKFTNRSEVATSRPLPTTLAEVEVRVTDAMGVVHLAQLFFASPGQVNYLIPAGASPGLALVEVLRNGQRTTAGQLLIEPVAPGLFSANANGVGVAAAVLLTIRPGGNQQWKVIYDESAPAGEREAIPLNIGTSEDSSYLLLFGTGMRHGSTLTAKIGGVEVVASGPAASSEFDGLDQVNLGPLPMRLSGSGEVEIELFLDGMKVNAVTVNIK